MTAKNLKINPLLKTFVVIFMSIIFLSLYGSALAQTYDPISVLPGVTDTDPLAGGVETYLIRAFTFIIGIGAILAVIQITIAGIEYMTSTAVGSIENAKKKIWNAVIGLLLLLTTVIILELINPDILNLRLGRGVQLDDSGQPVGPPPR